MWLLTFKLRPTAGRSAPGAPPAPPFAFPFPLAAPVSVFCACVAVSGGSQVPVSGPRAGTPVRPPFSPAGIPKGGDRSRHGLGVPASA